MINKINLKKGQVTIFIIAALVIVGLIIAGYFLLRNPSERLVSKELLPVYTYFQNCIDSETTESASLMGLQAGYLELPEFEAGSEYMPFSSQLDFLGTGVPYWYYISGNGIVKSQVPSLGEMESQLESYLEKRLVKCDFSSFEKKGFIIQSGIPKVDVTIKENKINVDVEMALDSAFGSESAVKSSHSSEVSSKLGKFYGLSKKIYDTEQGNLFLEDYGVDVLRLYAPGTGVEISCAPKVWLQDNIKTELKNALEGNVQAINLKNEKNEEYFVQEIDTEGERVNFLYSKNWPTKIEIYPEDDPIIVEPVGLQEGLGILGFCYIPYHFVYDLAYPVLIQVYDYGELFQFPVAVVIDKNLPREGMEVDAIPGVAPELCKHKLTEMVVYTYNTQLEPVEANIKFKCFDTSCGIGQTEIKGGDAVLKGMFPQCVNGYVIANAEGYAKAEQVVSTVNSGEVDIVMDKIYTFDLNVRVDGNDAEMAIINFVGDRSFSVAYPEQKEVQLSTGMYDINAYVYKNSSLTLAGSTTTKCIDIPKSGISGVFGGTEEKCFNLEIPSQTISSVVSGGGNAKYYFTDSEMMSSSSLEINAAGVPTPKSVEELQDSYILADEKSLWLEFN